MPWGPRPNRPRFPLGLRTRLVVLGPILLAGAWAGATTGSAQQVDVGAPVDRVTTLELDRELDARGNLGGVTVDRLGFLYVANFRDKVWRIDPEGRAETLTDSLYGASGNAVDSRGDLYQANFFAHTITRVRRTGEVETFASEGLEGPVGIAIDDDRLYVCNCNGNTLSTISPDGTVEELAASPLFACPNGLTFGPDGALYVTNFNHHQILRVSVEGEDRGRVEPFVTVPGGAGNAHITFARGFFWVTKIMANRLVRVSADGRVFPLAGSGEPGHDDGPAPQATFYRPNGIAASPQGDRLWVNTLVGEYSRPLPSRISVRIVDLATLGETLEAALEAGGVDALAPAWERYRSDPARALEDTVGEVNSLGYRLLSSRRVAAALALFELNAELHPDDVIARYNLGEAYRFTGQTEKAIAHYRRVLALDPEHSGAASRLEQLGDGG